MIKNRIWKRIAALGCCLLTGAGLFSGCMAQPVGAAAADGGIVTVSQSARWTDLENFQAVISVRADGLGNLSWTGNEGNEDNESPEGKAAGFQSDGGKDTTEIEPDIISEIQSEPASNLEDTSEVLSELPSESTPETVSGIQSRHLVVWLSEYFQPDLPVSLPEGCLMEEMPIQTADGRNASIYGFRYKINPGETEKILEIPVSLRREYRYPLEKRAVSTCQDAPLEKGVENLCQGGVYIVEKSGDSQRIICQTTSDFLEIPAGIANFSVEISPQEENAVAGERLLMNARLINTGQVPLYDLSLEAQAEEMEVTPVWEKEPEVETDGAHAVLQSLAEGEERTLSFYADPSSAQKGNLRLKVLAKTENPVSLEQTGEALVLIQPQKASFTVKKTADCDTARPGDTVTYQISINNTGQQTLHSVITTERFQKAGVSAAFLEQEGVTLNKTKTQAKIPEIVPGGCVNLKARVVLPDQLEDQNLVNQVIVVTDETGEDEAVRDQTSIRVENKKTSDAVSSGAKSGNGSSGAGRTGKGQAPKTGDNSHRELFQALILVSFLISALAARRMFFRRKD